MAGTTDTSRAPSSQILVGDDPNGGVVKTALARPGVSHVRRALQRFSARLGNQFSAAITYFLVLAMIPILMFAFAVTGFVLDVVRPELIGQIEALIEQVVPGQDELIAMLRNFLDNWASVGIVGVVSALYTGQGFIGNFTDAIRSQLADDLGAMPRDGFVKRLAGNVVILLGILVLSALTVGATVAGTGLASWLVGVLTLPDWAAGIVGSLGVLVTVAMAWVLFMFIFTLAPTSPIDMRTRSIGSAVGAIALTVLVNLATVLISLFSHSPTAALFGPVIAVMLALNYFARIVLIVAAWMGTAVPVAEPQEEAEAAAGAAVPAPAGALGAAAGGAAMIAATILGFRRFTRSGDSTGAKPGRGPLGFLRRR